MAEMTAGACVTRRSGVSSNGCRSLFGTLGILSMFLLIPALAAPPVLADEDDAEFEVNPLRPVDTSSPRNSLRSFIHHFDASVEAWRAGDEAERRRAVRQASKTIDFSAAPIRGWYIRGMEKMVLLKEILDRVELPAFDQIPGSEEVAEHDITRWIVPDTEIEIARIEDGPQAGQFLFTTKTVSELQEYYAAAQSLPYQPGAERGLYRELLISPGPLIPRSWIKALPSFGNRIVLGHALWQWITLAGIALIAVVLARLLYRWGRGWDKRFKGKDARMRFGLPLALSGIIVIALLVRRLAIDAVWLFGLPYDIVSYAVWIVAFGGAAWLVGVVIGRLGDVVSQHQEAGKKGVDSALLRIVFRLLGIIAIVYIGVFAAEFFGIPITPLLAGLGVGGIAIALAIRPTLENIIGGLTLFADRPVRVGDFCRYGDQIGTVEQVGLRSTRVRSLERTIVTIPNAEFSQMQLDNFQVRDMRLLKTVLRLRYETTTDQLRFVLARLRRMLLGHPMVTPEPARVRFIGFGEYSLDLEVFAYLRCQDQDTFLAIQEDILLRMADIVANAGTSFAYASQRAHLGRDTSLDAERRETAEAKVEGWREKGSLPFPEFEKMLRWQLEDILDYPPRGSPDFQQRTDPPQEPPEPDARQSK